MCNTPPISYTPLLLNLQIIIIRRKYSPSIPFRWNNGIGRLLHISAPLIVHTQKSLLRTYCLPRCRRWSLSSIAVQRLLGSHARQYRRTIRTPSSNLEGILAMSSSSVAGFPRPWLTCFLSKGAFLESLWPRHSASPMHPTAHMSEHFVIELSPICRISGAI